MPTLLSGSVLRRGGSEEFLDLEGAQPQLPATETTETGFTVITDSLLRTSYSKSLGFVEIQTATMRSLLPSRSIKITHNTGSRIISTSTNTGVLLIDGGIGVYGNMFIDDDVIINDLTIGNGSVYQGVNNIVLRGKAIPPPDDFDNGQESIAIGYDTLTGLVTANKSLAIGRFALSSGTSLRRSIAIGDSSLKNVGIKNGQVSGYILDADLNDPIVITIPNHQLKDGDYIQITGVTTGTTELNNQYYYIQKINSSTFELFSDVNLSLTVNGGPFNSWNPASTTTAIVTRVYSREGNIAYGVEAGLSLVDGSENIFIGHQAGINVTTGTYNIIIGQNLNAELTNVNNIISIGGDNVVDGVDNQINIGSVIYYNGLGKLDFNANTEFGIGTQASVVTPGPYTPASTITGSLIVNGGGILRGNFIIGKNFQTLGTETNYISGDLLPSTGTVSLGSLSNPFKDLYLSNSSLYIGGTVALGKTTGTISFGGTDTSVYISSVNTATTTTGALRVAGGVSIGGDLVVTGKVIALGLTGNSPNLQEVTSSGNSTTNQISFTNLTESTGTTTGAVVISGGLGVGKRVSAESVKIADTLFDSSSISVTSTSTTVLDSFNLNEYRSAKYLVQIDEGIGSSADFELTEMLVVFDNAGNYYPLSYGVKTPGSAMGSLTFSVSSNVAYLNYTASTATNKIIKVLRTGMIR